MSSRGSFRGSPGSFKSFPDGSTIASEDGTAAFQFGGNSGYFPFSPSNQIEGTKDVGSPDAFSRELSRLQEEQMLYTRKIDREKKRKELIQARFDEATKNLRTIQDKTKNGRIVKDIEAANKKQLGRLEHHLQTSKIKLSVSKNENLKLKKQVQDFRRDKMLHLQILNDMNKEADSAKYKLKNCQKEIITFNERKHKVKVAIANIKNQMLKDMEEFSHELNQAKANISNAQSTILTVMREKMATAGHMEMMSAGETFGTFGHGEQALSPLSRQLMAGDAGQYDTIREDAHSHNEAEIKALLEEQQATAAGGVTFSSTEDLIAALEASEEKMFTLYNETQEKEEEMETIDVDNKHLEQQVEVQLARLHALEGHHDEVKQELEKNIQNLRAQIGKYDADYAKNMEILNSVSENLISLLQNVSVDEDAADQQLLSTGVSDRNVDDFLGLIEQRIDDLIQMSKAAHHQSIRRDDFLRMVPVEKNAAFRAPRLPSLLDGEDETEAGGGGGNGDYGGDEAVKVQPINIQVLKELMAKKVQQGGLRWRRKHKGGGAERSLGFTPSMSGLHGSSRQLSAASLHSGGSSKSMASN